MSDSKYELMSDGSYRIQNYDKLPGFCSFLPGVAGEEGVPLWCMYVNRGQGVVSFGSGGKDSAIMEFFPATWAYQQVSIQGFRTFCIIDGIFYEPFQRIPNEDEGISRTLYIEADRIVFEEINPVHNIKSKVEYCSSVKCPVPALLRKLTITNLSDISRTIKVLDGMPVMVPAGFNDFGLKKMRHIMEAYAQVVENKQGTAFFASKVNAHDEAEVEEITERNFYHAWVNEGGSKKTAKLVIDPCVVFGHNNNLEHPYHYIENGDINFDAQVWENRLPCAFSLTSATLAPGASHMVETLAGAAVDECLANDFIAEMSALDSFDKMRSESLALINEVTQPAFSVSGQPMLDAYGRQNYLDNVLRGGIPKMFPSADGDVPLHLYSRRHGDLERDYNEFYVSPHPLADGPGNYRDICQNRRYDVWFYPEIGDQEIRMFLSLIQADGYNPLAITGYRWELAANTNVMELCPTDEPVALRAFRRIVEQPFSPGALLGWKNQYSITLSNTTEWIHGLLQQCTSSLVAMGHEGGYWIDHWIYIVDLLEAYEGIWPDAMASMLTENADIPWFDEGAFVEPRSHKYVMRPGGPMQLDAISDGYSTSIELQAVTPLAKCCALLAIKAISLDAEGIGIEMEAGRPGWNDSLNGLPGLFGSSTCETAEAARLARWLLDVSPVVPDTQFPALVAQMIQSVSNDLDNESYDWDRAATLRESYRETLRVRTGSDMETLDGPFLRTLLEKIEKRMRNGIERAVDPDTNLVTTYYNATPIEPEVIGDDTTDMLNLKVSKFDRKAMPLFLEGQVHYLRLLKDNRAAAHAIYEGVRDSGLFDTELAMYKLNECINDMPKEIGRTRTFSRGWFENESVWLHMSYKYLLELLQCNLHEAFFKDAATMLVPFMDPERYGRSLLENSSFIACSACPDPAARGRGFIARLTGSTAEYIHIWLLLTVGAKPFTLQDGALQFALNPTLPADWFTNESTQINWKNESVVIPADAFACSLFNSMLLIYHNPTGIQTYGEHGVKPLRYSVDGLVVEAEHITGEVAEKLRNGECDQIEVWLGTQKP